MRCYNCGSTKEFVSSTKPLTTRIGDVEVQDRSIPLKVCADCDKWALGADVLERAELRAAVVALSDLSEMSGERLRAVRKILGLTQRELGKRLDTRHETLSRIENAEEPAPEWLRAAMLGFVSEKLHDIEGNESIEILPQSA